MNIQWRLLFATFIAALLFATQTATLSHAVEYGDDNHSHEGIECELTLIASELDPIIPTPVVTLMVTPHERINWVASYRSTKPARLDNKGPPGQAPPV